MLRSFIHRAINDCYKLESTRIIVLGNQKSGTTAIAKLLAEHTAQSVLLDTPLIWEPNLTRMVKEKTSLEKIINHNKYYFSRQIIKEPNLTFFFDELISVYPASVKYIFIVRDPRDNIRSLLNRIKVPGNLNDIGKYIQNFTIHERVLFDKKIIPYNSDHYIEQLAERWVRAVDVYHKYKTKLTLVRYEDFKKSKATFINDLALQMGCVAKKDISAIVDIQYQPRGNQEVSWSDFFGKENLDRINKICRPYLQELGYPNE